MKDFKQESFYVLPGPAMKQIVEVAKRLYTEMRLDGDGMRDLAQSLEHVTNEAFEYEYEDYDE